MSMATSRATAGWCTSGWRRRCGRCDRSEPRTAVEIVPEIYGEPLRATTANWLLSETLSYLRHLEGQGRIRSEPVAGADGWVLAGD